jgi:uncharacterized protein YndB with AHSA1/START domain
MAIALELEVRIGRPPADVYAHLAAVERWPEWLIASGIVRVERVEGGSAEHLRVEQRVAGRATTLDARITAAEPPSRFALEGRDAEGVGVVIDASLVPDDLGTRLRWRLELRLPLRYRMLEGMVTPQARRAAALDLEAFKRRLESVATD